MRTIKRAIGHEGATVTKDILKQLISNINEQWSAEAVNIILNEAINETIGDNFARTGTDVRRAGRRPRPAKGGPTGTDSGVG